MLHDLGGEAEPKKIEYKLRLNVPEEKLVENVRINVERGLPQLKRADKRPGHWILAAGGPSLESSVVGIKRLKRRTGRTAPRLATVGGSYRYLLDKGVIADYHVMLDATPGNTRFVEKVHPRTTFLVASSVDPSVYDLLLDKGCKVIQWHMRTTSAPKVLDALTDKYGEGNFMAVMGGCSVGLHALALGSLMGFRYYDLFGLDSCYVFDESSKLHHSYSQEKADEYARVLVECNNRKWITNFWMMTQVHDFAKWLQFYQRPGDMIEFHSDSLIKNAVEVWYRDGWTENPIKIVKVLDQAEAA